MKNKKEELLKDIAEKCKDEIISSEQIREALRKFREDILSSRQFKKKIKN